MADDVVTRALERFKIAKEAWAEIYQKAEDDLRFLSDEDNAQWDERLLKDRKNRPIYTVDQLTQFVHQVENDERMNTPSIDIIPDDEGVDQETAEVLQGIVKGIEYKSNADAAYDTGGSSAIRGSFGFIRVDHGYVRNEGAEQELQIKRVVNPFSIYIDPDSIQPDGSDAMYGFVLEEIPTEAFDKAYPTKTATSFTDNPSLATQDSNKVILAEYFEIIEDTSDQDYGGTKRKITKRKVMRYKLSGEDTLESTSFPGEYVPLVPVYGEEAWVKGKRNLYSLIRKAKSAQRIFNLGISLNIEMLMKQPQASFMAAAGQVSGFEHEYADPTKANVMHYNVEDVNGNKPGKPERISPPQPATGFNEMSLEAANNIRSALGMYNASAGKREGDASGVALKQLDRSSDVGNFHFSDNLTRSITHVGKIIICAKDEIYDTPRTVKMTDKEENTKMIGINGYRVKDQDRDYHIKGGTYDVRVTTGPSFTTQRQEAAANYTQIIQAMPDLMPVIGDLVFKYQDTAGSQAISARLKKAIELKTPELLSPDEKDKDAPDPQVEALQQQLQQITQAAQTQIQQLQAELQNKQSDIMVKQGDLQLKAKELELKQGDQQLKAQEMQSKAVLEAKKLEIEQQKVEIDAYTAQKAPEAVQPQVQQQQTPAGIKLDTTGFQMMKTPEQEAIDNDKATQEQAEMQAKQAQSVALIQGIAGIQQLLGALVEQTGAQTQAISQQTQVMAAPITLNRDDNGELVGAQ